MMLPTVRLQSDTSGIPFLVRRNRIGRSFRLMSMVLTRYALFVGARQSRPAARQSDCETAGKE